ncbi:hypothetical protein P9112_013732 [Eukaryota sp. TZLM1-RC]
MITLSPDIVSSVASACNSDLLSALNSLLLSNFNPDIAIETCKSQYPTDVTSVLEQLSPDDFDSPVSLSSALELSLDDYSHIQSLSMEGNAPSFLSLKDTFLRICSILGVDSVELLKKRINLLASIRLEEEEEESLDVDLDDFDDGFNDVIDQNESIDDVSKNQNEVDDDVSKDQNESIDDFSKEQNEVDDDFSKDQNESIDDVSKDQNEVDDDFSKDQNESIDDASKDQNEVDDDFSIDQNESIDDVSKDQNEVDDDFSKDQNESIDDVSKNQNESIDDVSKNQNESIDDVSKDQNEVDDDVDDDSELDIDVDFSTAYPIYQPSYGEILEDENRDQEPNFEDFSPKLSLEKSSESDSIAAVSSPQFSIESHHVGQKEDQNEGQNEDQNEGQKEDQIESHHVGQKEDQNEGQNEGQKEDQIESHHVGQKEDQNEGQNEGQNEDFVSDANPILDESRSSSVVSDSDDFSSCISYSSETSSITSSSAEEITQDVTAEYLMERILKLNNCVKDLLISVRGYESTFRLNHAHFANKILSISETNLNQNVNQIDCENDHQSISVLSNLNFLIKRLTTKRKILLQKLCFVLSNGVLTTDNVVDFCLEAFV